MNADPPSGGCEVYRINVVAFVLNTVMLSLSQTFHPEVDVCLGHTGSRHVHDATFWLVLQRQRGLWRADGGKITAKNQFCFGAG